MIFIFTPKPRARYAPHYPHDHMAIKTARTEDTNGNINH